MLVLAWRWGKPRWLWGVRSSFPKFKYSHQAEHYRTWSSFHMFLPWPEVSPGSLLEGPDWWWGQCRLWSHGTFHWWAWVKVLSTYVTIKERWLVMLSLYSVAILMSIRSSVAFWESDFLAGLSHCGPWESTCTAELRCLLCTRVFLSHWRDNFEEWREELFFYNLEYLE
jgi:hypothetical protein